MSRSYHATLGKFKSEYFEDRHELTRYLNKNINISQQNIEIINIAHGPNGIALIYREVNWK